MKAAVIFAKGEIPQYTTKYPEPVPHNENELLITVQAAAIKNLDKSQASGRHYSTEKDISKAKIPGGDGVGLLADGTKVYALGINGMLAEKALVDKRRMIKIPNGLDDVTAAALPNAVAGSAMALLFRAGMKGGETVLINGATGFTGRIAVQIARHYGAKKIIVTGRNEEALQSLLALGADITISTKQENLDFVQELKQIHAQTPIDIVIDYLWGRSAELILESVKGDGAFTHKTHYVSIGAMAGETISLSSEILRSVDLHISGSGLGSWTKEEMQQLFTQIVPEMFQLALEKKLVVGTQTISLENVEKAWTEPISGGKRWVVTM